MRFLRRLFPGGRPTAGPRIVISTDGERLRVDADWPDPSRLDSEEAHGNANALVMMGNIMTRGDGLGLSFLLEAVGHNAKLRGEDEFGAYVIKSLNQIAAGQAERAAGKADGKRPVMSPWDVFPGEGQG